MSIFNVHVTPAKAFILTDTAQYTLSGEPVGFATKFDLFPLANSIMSGVGSHAVFRRVAEGIRALPFATSLDDLIERAPFIVQDALQHVQDLAAFTDSMGPGPWPAGHCTDTPLLHPFHTELFFVGLSKVRNAFEAWVVTTHPENGVDCHERAVQYHGATLLVPPMTGYDPHGKIKVPDGLVNAAKVQKRIYEESGQGMAGGELVLVTLTKFGTEIRKVHRFPDFERVTEAAAERRATFEAEAVFRAAADPLAVLRRLAGHLGEDEL